MKLQHLNMPHKETSQINLIEQMCMAASLYSLQPITPDNQKGNEQ